MPEAFDVTVIGAGPGGYVAAIRAAQVGLKTAIIEKDKDLGGTCLLRGCIPTKELLHAAHVYDLVNNPTEFGVSVEGFKLHFDKVMARKNRVVAKLSKGVDFLMKKHKITVFKVTGRFEGKGRLTVKDGAGPRLEIFFFNDTATTEIYTLSLHDALPNSVLPLSLPTCAVQPDTAKLSSRSIMAF